MKKTYMGFKKYRGYNIVVVKRGDEYYWAVYTNGDAPQVGQQPCATKEQAYICAETAVDRLVANKEDRHVDDG